MTAEVVYKELNIPQKYAKPSSRDDRIEVLVHRSWLRQLVKNRRIPDFIFHDRFSDDEVSALFKQGESFAPAWIHVTITVIKKENSLIIPLARPRQPSKPDAKLSLSQILHYVAHTNHKNLWKEAYKKYNNGLVEKEAKEEGSVQLTEFSSLVREVMLRLYGVQVVRLGCDSSGGVDPNFSPHPNLLPAIACLETLLHFLIIQEARTEHTLHDCVTFSPAILASCYSRPMLIVYQLVRLMRHLHDSGLVLGDISLHDIRMTDDLWIQVMPRVTDNIYKVPRTAGPDDEIKVELTPDEDPPDLGSLTQAWVAGALSNYDYLCALNKLAGRRVGDPRRHYVMPWVSDLASRSGPNWRDLTKSKFRLNKGERQLDLTYQLPPASGPPHVPHHIPDVLSEITYFVYLSRVTPRSVLCKYVRPRWVPAEYPASIQRLHDWSPDECIPEFFTDPSVFKSMHSDLGDLEVPAWAGSPQEFISQHRAALESSHVSERLHHWIDLTFGFKLSGSAAVKAKNVCLQLVDGHTNLTGSGVVQLFEMPHPHRLAPSPYWSRVPPRLHTTKSSVVDEDEGQSSGLEDDDPPPSVRTTSLSLSRFISRSRSSLATWPSGEGSSEGSGSGGGKLVLPKDYSPASALSSVEALHGFVRSASLHSTSERSYTLLAPRPSPPSRIYKQMVAARRATEMQVLGCLIIEMLLAPKLRVFASSSGEVSVERRLANCRHVVSQDPDAIPRCLRPLALLLLKEEFEQEGVTELGTPPACAHQLVEPLLCMTLVGFPPLMPSLHYTLTVLRQLEASDDPPQHTVKGIVGRVEALCEDQSCLGLLVPYIVRLLRSPKTDVVTAWYLFDHVARGLGPAKARQELLEPVLRLYDWEVPREGDLSKRVKLYHRSFLLRLLVRFGLPTFLETLVPPLVEAVGGYHDVDHATSSYLQSEVEDGVEVEPTPLSPLDEDSSADSDHKAPVTPTLQDRETDTDVEPEVFLLEEDQGEETESCGPQSAVSLQNLLIDNLEPHSEEGEDSRGISGVEEEGSWMQKNLTSLKQFRHDTLDTEHSKVSEVSGESVVWLAARLGPVLTARALSRNLLRMLALCYSREPNLRPAHASPHLLVGDENARSVARALSSIAGLYGEQVVVVQYLPHIADVVSLCKRKLTSNLEGGIVGCLALLAQLLDHLSDHTFAEVLQEVVVRSIVSPSVRLMASCGTVWPSGQTGRSAVAVKLLGAIAALVRRAAPQQRIALLQTLQRFFLAFSKAHAPETLRSTVESESSSLGGLSMKDRLKRDTSESPPLSSTPSEAEPHRTQALDELKEVLSAEFAYASYVPFANFFGESMMEQSLKNYELIKELCAQHVSARQAGQIPGVCAVEPAEIVEPAAGSAPPHRIGSFGNVVVIGNRIDLQEPITAKKGSSPGAGEEGQVPRRSEAPNRQLRGNWLAYWEHEVGRSAKDTRLNVKQIKLQGFAGHCGSVRHITPLASENSFMSAGRDKTVRLWSLRSQGDGSQVSAAQWTYTGHRKAVVGLGFVDSLRLTVSSDCVVHVWDPFVGRVVSAVDPGRAPPVNTLRPLPSPSASVLCATAESTIRTLDTRTCSYVNELKVSMSPQGLLRCVVVSPSSSWLAVGHATGLLTVLDLRTGAVVASWKAHDAEILQLVAVDEYTLLSSALDQAVSVWNISDGKLKFVLKGATEPVHCLEVYGGEVVCGTTANRIGVHTSLSTDASFSSSRLRADTLRGVLTSMALLPLNRLLLLGADSGAISLIC